ncbi:hypothetical protein [Robertkochia solimangrovi]|uniref:hypothetical protein n=1 Tax=Robertkochia solimangrovi TaxID=2213046 RepID=UPI00117FDB1D|nr:hypothetical protein [Robertkochia solimangrovi]TRZ42735.1 hypothetical protein DMZ48_11720 [Robertkochia solimangrovi]
MKQLIQFLKGLDDVHLAYYARFSSGNLSEDIQNKIEHFLLAKNLTYERIDQLIRENPTPEMFKATDRCPDCYSDQLKVYSLDDFRTSGKLYFEDIINTDNKLSKLRDPGYLLECKVCSCIFSLKDYNIPKPAVNGVKLNLNKLNR